MGRTNVFGEYYSCSFYEQVYYYNYHFCFVMFLFHNSCVPLLTDLFFFNFLYELCDSFICFQVGKTLRPNRHRNVKHLQAYSDKKMNETNKKDTLRNLQIHSRIIEVGDCLAGFHSPIRTAYSLWLVALHTRFSQSRLLNTSKVF